MYQNQINRHFEDPEGGKAVLTDPTLEHLPAKIIAWLISTVFLGIIVSVVLPDPNEYWLRQMRQRTQQRLTRAPQLRTTGRKLVLAH